MTKTKEPLERRVHPRIAVDLPCEIQISGRTPLSCRIRDLCQDGLLLECIVVDDKQVFRYNDQTFIRFELPNQGESGLIKAWIKLLQRGDGFFGARFLHLSAPNKAALCAYLEAPLPSVVESVGLASGDAAKTAMTILRRVTLRYIDDITKPLLDEMREILWATSERACSDIERNDIAGDLSRLERAVQQRRFQEQLRRELLDAVLKQAPEGASNQAPQGPASDMSLIDQDGFELWLAVSALIERLEQQLGEALKALRALKVGVFGAATVLSIEPQGLAHSLRHALGATGMSTQGQLLCLRATAKPLPVPLGGFYLALTEAWAISGITSQASPGLRPTPPKKTQSAKATTPAHKLPPAPALPNPIPPPAPVTNTRAALTGKILPRRVITVQTTPAIPFTAADLSAIFAADNMVTMSGESLKSKLAAMLSPGANGTHKPLSPVLHERVKISEQMLTWMLEDCTVPTRARDLLQHLAMRVMAASVNELGFFTTARHPLVEVLDRLEYLATFLPVQGVPKSQIQHSIEHLMQKAVVINPADISALQHLSHQLTNLQQHLGEEWQRYAEQVVINCEGRERGRLAYDNIRTKLNVTFAGQSMHPAIAELARQAWRILLQLTWIREGGEGTIWQHYWRTLLELHRICSHRDQTLTAGRPLILLQTLKEGLQITGFDPYQRALLEERIEAALQMASVGVATELTVFAAIPPAPTEVQDAIPDDAANSTQWIQALAVVDALEIGANLQLHNGKNEDNHLRLVWRSSDGKELVFLDPSMLKAKTLGRVALARAIQGNTAQSKTRTDQTLISRATNATLQEMQQRIRYHETHDNLTGLSNRRQLSGVLTQLISASNSALANHSISVFKNQVLGFLDLDRFDAMTGICGYSVGEQLLTTVARLLKNILDGQRPTCLAYLGGSRFAFLLPATDIATIEHVGRHICDNLAATPFHWQGTAYPLSGSIGLVLITPASEHPEAILSAADTACITAQRNGGGRVVLFNKDNADIFKHQKSMNDWIQAEAAVKGGRLRLRGQRIAHTVNPNESPHHYEILLSVYDEHGTPLPLEAFITAAETFNLMEKIDHLVFIKAIEWVRDNPIQARNFGGVAINLSGKSLGDSKLVGAIHETLKRFDIPPKLISFEVTETAVIANIDQAAAIIMGIRDIGCHFALDDFGAGLSSYSYLKRLPVDYIKIDGSFIKDILSNPNDQIIVKSINEVAHLMGKQTIAEYVENLEILERLREMGIDYVQGYAVGKPQFLDEV